MIVKSGYDLFPVFSFYEVLEICCFIFSINERVVVIKQSIIVLSGSIQCECSLITSIDQIDKKVAQAIGEGFAAFLCCLKDQRSALNRYEK